MAMLDGEIGSISDMIRGERKIMIAEVISFPIVSNEDVVFWCKIGENKLCCISSKKDRLKNLIFIKPGQKIDLLQIDRIVYLLNEKEIDAYLYLHKAKLVVR